MLLWFLRIEIGLDCRDVIERLIKLGFYYRELDRFSTKSRNLSWIRSFSESPTLRTSEFSKGKKDKQSVYKRAIANGIIEVLSVYRSAVLHIEQKLLSDSLPILATVTQGLNKVRFNVCTSMFIFLFICIVLVFLQFVCLTLLINISFMDMERNIVQFFLYSSIYDITLLYLSYIFIHHFPVLCSFATSLRAYSWNRARWL